MSFFFFLCRPLSLSVLAIYIPLNVCRYRQVVVRFPYGQRGKNLSQQESVHSTENVSESEPSDFEDGIGQGGRIFFLHVNLYMQNSNELFFRIVIKMGTSFLISKKAHHLNIFVRFWQSSWFFLSWCSCKSWKVSAYLAAIYCPSTWNVKFCAS